MKAISIIRTVVALSVSLIPLSCEGDDIFYYDEEIISEENQSKTQTQTDPQTPSDSETQDPETTETTSGTTTEDQAGNDSDDNVANTTFDRTITVTYSGSSVSVSGDDNGSVTASGAHVTVKNTGTENIIYKLTGSSTNGSFKDPTPLPTVRQPPTPPATTRT